MTEWMTHLFDAAAAVAVPARGMRWGMPANAAFSPCRRACPARPRLSVPRACPEGFAAVRCWWCIPVAACARQPLGGAKGGQGGFVKAAHDEFAFAG